jgi:hypothetical protein
MLSRFLRLAIFPAALLALSSAPAHAYATHPDLGVPLIAVARAVERSALVVEGAPRRYRGRSSRAAFHVTASLKGDADPGQPIIVDFEKAPYGIWPKRGQRAVLCLSKGDGEHSYELASYYASVLPATDSAKSAIREILVPGGVEPATPTDETQPTDETETTTDGTPTIRAVELADDYADMVADSETVLVGALTGIRPSSEGFVARLVVEEALVGYAGFKAPVRVEFVAGGRGALGDPPPPGRYVMFLRGSEAGDGFTVVSRTAGAARLTGDRRDAKIKRAVTALAGAAGYNRLGLTTVQATLAEWQDAWNARDLERCMRCYSPRNALRREYDSGEGRARLTEQIKSYAGQVKLSIQSVVRPRAPGAGEEETAAVTVIVTLSAGSPVDRPTAKMKFVREGREWLILEEGF